MSDADLIQLGEQLRDRGTDRAARRRPAKVLRGELAMLTALLPPGATATTDCIQSNPAAKYRDNGKWVGSVVLGLLRACLIQEVGIVRSVRPARHRSKIGLYTLADRAAAERRLAILPRLIEQAETEDPEQLEDLLEAHIDQGHDR